MSLMIPAWVDGALTPVEKLEVHRRGLRHKAISVFLLRGREVLLQRRALGKYHTPGLWTNTCCTHPHWDESPAVCAARRLEEELGISGTQPIHRHSLEYRAELPNGLVEHEVVEVFLVRATAPVTVRPDPDEVMETRWADYHDLLAEVARHPDRFTPWICIYLADHAAEIFGPELAHATQGN